METTRIIAKFDLYPIFGRILEGVNALVTIEYSIPNIIELSEITEENLKAIRIEFAREDIDYLSSSPYSITKIRQSISDYLDQDTIEEIWAEAISENEYKQILFLYV